MSGKVRRVDFHPDEYITGVGGVLTAEQQGVYWMICATIMSEGGPIPFNERRLAALCLARPSRVRVVVEALIEMGKITLTENNELTQKRALSEVERSTKRIQTASENGSKGGRRGQIDQQNQQNLEATGLSAEKLTTNHQPATIEKNIANARPKPQKKRHSYTEAFEQYWAGYPTDSLMSKLDASKAFQALSEDEQAQAIASLSAFKAYCASHPDYRPVHANRYLSQRRFEGFNKTQEATAAREFVAVGSPAWNAMLRLRNVNTLPHSDRNGVRGWFFDKAEIKQALQAPTPMDWKTAGAA